MSHSFPRLHLAICGCLILTLISVHAQEQKLEIGGDEPVPPGYTLIDGKVHPELIPQWKRWRAGLRLMAVTKTKKMGAFYGPLEEAMSPSEQDLLYKEAYAQVEREDRQIERAEKEILQQPLTDEEKTQRLWSLELENRWASLNARDRLRDALSPDSFTALAAWVDDKVTGLSSLVPTRELDQFRLPQ